MPQEGVVELSSRDKTYKESVALADVVAKVKEFIKNEYAKYE